MMIKTKRVYDPPEADDGTRVLVERLWPRGMRKEKLQMDAWLKDAAPSSELRQWFSHDPAKWIEFQRRYRRELASHPGALNTLAMAARRGNVTLLFSAHDTEHNNAVALKEFIGKHHGH